MPELLDAGDRPVASYSLGERGGLPLADLLAPLPGAAADAVAAAILHRLPGFLVATEEQRLRGPLIAGGARVRREVETMTLTLAPSALEAHAPPAGVRLGPLGRTLTPELVALNLAAYGLGRVDHHGVDEAAEAAVLRPLVEGGARWSPLAASRAAVRTADGALLGAAILADQATPPPLGGPWLTSIFRRPGPALRGLGAALLDGALEAARADGLATVGLAVTLGNPARGLYASRGFTPTSTSVTLLVPGTAAPPG